MNLIKFNRPIELSYEMENLHEEKLYKFIAELYHKDYFLLHTCTAALEVAAMALNLQPDDEVIMPSFTFVATANAFARLGVKIVFVDVDETMNIDLNEVKKAITAKTKVVVPVHYGGLCCDMDLLMTMAEEYDFYVVEDAAQSIGALYKKKPLGTIGDFGCISFHETKNIHCGEGGLLLINNKTFKQDVDEIVHHGTNQVAFRNHEVDNYTWQRIGGAYLMDSFRKKILAHQFEALATVNQHRIKLYNAYYKIFEPYLIPEYCEYNGHLFFIKCKNNLERIQLIDFLKSKGIEAFSHYEPLHLSKRGKIYKTLNMKITEQADTLLRLPIYYDLSFEIQNEIIERIKEFYE
ncbi:MAG: dTDP-4-amino-4,6-dideoxygalactose transaminase [Clostridia bacterium]|nr:dTDP-4-amino-4,6-dideoxygalactose transaminase [Clostridia bacterium]